MKVVNLGEECGTYDDIQLQEAKKTNKFGKMYYLKDRIYLVQRTPSTGYNMWESARGEKQLRLSMPEDLQKELINIEKAIISKFPNLLFKTHDDGNIYVKFGKDCSTEIVANGELQYTIQIYGIFTQNSTGNTFFQLELIEQQSKKMSLLNRFSSPTTTGYNYEPNSKAWEKSNF